VTELKFQYTHSEEILKKAMLNKATRPATLKCLEEDLAIQAEKISELDIVKSEILKQIWAEKNALIASVLKEVTLAHGNAEKSMQTFS
jgi:hypothetical protein